MKKSKSLNAYMLYHSTVYQLEDATKATEEKRKSRATLREAVAVPTPDLIIYHHRSRRVLSQATRRFAGSWFAILRGCLERRHGPGFSVTPYQRYFLAKRRQLRRQLLRSRRGLPDNARRAVSRLRNSRSGLRIIGCGERGYTAFQDGLFVCVPAIERRQGLSRSL